MTRRRGFSADSAACQKSLPSPRVHNRVPSRHPVRAHDDSQPVASLICARARLVGTSVSRPTSSRLPADHGDATRAERLAHPRWGPSKIFPTIHDNLHQLVAPKGVTKVLIQFVLAAGHQDDPPGNSLTRVSHPVSLPKFNQQERCPGDSHRPLCPRLSLSAATHGELRSNGEASRRPGSGVSGAAMGQSADAVRKPDVWERRGLTRPGKAV